MAEVMSSEVHHGKPAQSSQPGPRGRRLPLVLGALLVLSTAGMYGWRWRSVAELERASLQQRNELLSASQAALSGQAEELLRLSAVPLSWTVGTAMTQNDFQGVNGYLKQMVQQPHVIRIAVADLQGQIRASTDRKFEGAALGDSFPGVDLSAPEPTVQRQFGEQRVVVPVMGPEARLGTLVLSYDAAALEGRIPAPE